MTLYPPCPAFPQSSVPSIARIQDKDLLFNFVKTSKYVHHSDTSFFNDAITNIALHWRSRNCGILFLKIRQNLQILQSTIIHLYIYDNSQIVFTPVEIIVTAANINQLFLVFVVCAGLGCRFIRVLVTITFINLMDLLYFHITMTQWKKQTLLMETSYILCYSTL